jgi:DNA modification methylase
MRELLSDQGTLYLHCDHHQNNHLKTILNEIFGNENLRNEIIWHYDIGHAPKNDFKKKHDTIYRYSKTGEYIYNEIRIPPSNEERYNKTDDDGRKYMVRGDTGKKVYADKGQVEDDVWTYYKSDRFRTLNSMATERREVNYPTQKPEALIKRIIKASSNKGDLVFDCFMGSGTTQAVAMKMGRKFLGADINLGAIQTTTSRLERIMKKSKEKKDRYLNFELYNVNNYDIFRNPTEAKNLLIKALEINPLERNNLYDGEKDGRKVKIMPINRIATKADLNDLITNFPYKEFEKRKDKSPNQPVEELLLVCMGHEPDLVANLEKEVNYNLDIEVVDILRDKKELTFKRNSEVDIDINKGVLEINNFYPLNLLQKLSLMKENIEDWKQLVESILIDWNYNGEFLEPDIIDVPDLNEIVKGRYMLPENVGEIRIKITDLLSEVLEVTVNNE